MQLKTIEKRKRIRVFMSGYDMSVCGSHMIIYIKCWSILSDVVSFI